MIKNNLIQLVYHSYSNFEATSELVKNILGQARIANKKHDITGCLICYNNVFYQLLEGDKNKVENLFNNIMKDSRHRKVTLIFKENINERLFPNWSMAFYEFDNNYKEVEKNFIKKVQFFSENNEKQSEVIENFLRNGEIYCKLIC